ncbi:putative protein OS=Bosea thiooxidans OX=53254 GN=SAMN05660750_03299 PE=4 SV=1 [Bosea thiooxidans]|uniref:Uncharacterized protein n=1 Tax=Bosea thiooxidans TaxID=53254 RepID=A0A1T5FKD9_9HYPH|nr:hypothetical protein [Bosea thiooxidans]SKB96643.1 hypothetical protein SAMN05660750_03299 [Bosea thiooxidans]
MTAIDERALAAAFDILWPAQEWNGEERVCRAATRATITAYLQALRPGSTGETEGWVLVPKEPTMKMLESGMAAMRVALSDGLPRDQRQAAGYRAMLAAAGGRDE